MYYWLWHFNFIVQLLCVMLFYLLYYLAILAATLINACLLAYPCWPARIARRAAGWNATGIRTYNEPTGRSWKHNTPATGYAAHSLRCCCCCCCCWWYDNVIANSHRYDLEQSRNINTICYDGWHFWVTAQTVRALVNRIPSHGQTASSSALQSLL